MTTDTKPNLISGKFEQCVGDILNLSGCTQIYGTMDVHPQGTIDSCSGYKISGTTVLNTSSGSVTSIRLGQGAGINNNAGICNVFIGYNAGCNSTGSNRLYIGNSAACTLIYGDFTGNTLTLPRLKLCTTPSTGTCSDSVLVWNSSDKIVKIVPYSSGSTNSVTANNGLNIINNNVRLGGALTGDTCITGLYSLGFNNSYVNITGNSGVNIGGCIKLISTFSVGSASDKLLTWNSSDKYLKILDSSCMVLTANNGLTKSGANLRLGGALTGNTAISGAYTLTFSGGSKINSNCGFQISGTTVLNTSPNTIRTIFLGGSGNNTSTGVDNIGIGSAGLNSLTTGCNNIGFGYQALYSNTTGCDNIANGLKALYGNTTGANNIAFGNSVMQNNTTGSNNFAAGIGSLALNDSGSNNISIGCASLCQNWSGCNNFGAGHFALFTNETGSNNVAIGSCSLYNTWTSDNIGIGQNAGYLNCSGSLNMFLGRCAGYNETGSGKLYIATGATNQLIYGDFAIKEVTLPKLKLCETPADGTSSNNVLVWDSSSCCVKKIASVGASLTSGYLPYWNGTNLANSGAYYDGSNNIGMGTTAPTAKLHLPAGTATASTAPLKFTAGTNLTNPEAGAVEFDGTNLYFTPSSTRRTVAFLDSPTFTGTPLAPTACAGTNTTQIATTAFVTTAVSAAGGGATVDDVAPTGSVGKLWFQPTNGSLMVYAGGAWVTGNRNGIDGKGWTGGSYNASTGVVTFGSSDGLGFSTGDLRASLTDDSVTYAKLGTGFKNAITDNDGAFDFSAAGIITANISGTTTISFTNLQRNKTLKVKLVITNSATINFPSYAVKLAGSQTLGNGTFYLYFDCWESTGGSELVLYSIMKAA